MSGTEYLYESPEERLQWGVNGPERVKLAQEMGPLERSSSNFLNRKGLGGTQPTEQTYRAMAQKMMQGTREQPAQAYRAPTPDELMQQAHAALEAAAAQKTAQLASPALGERDGAGYRIPDWLDSYMKRDDYEK